MIRFYLIFGLFFFVGQSLEAQRQYTISGFVEDSLSGERLPRATFYEGRLQKGVACNDYGFFSLTLSEGDYRIRVDYVGYYPAEFDLSLHRDTVFVVNLRRAGMLEEAVVEGVRPFSGSPRMGEHTLSVGQIRTMPALAGESDVLKVLHHLPGVNSGVEGMAGFSVRGGTPDQTQILLDGIPVYNVNHALGYFSVFNGAALQQVTLLKSAIPARYGGRLASVLDLSMREGNMRRYSGEATVSPLAGTATIEGPIVKEKMSFLLSGRVCWANALFQLGQVLAGGDFRTGYNFYDLNAKVNWKADRNNRFYLSFYNGRDGFYTKWNLKEEKPDRDGFNWGNISIAGRWNHVFDARTFSNVTLYYSRFHYNKFQDTYLSDVKRFDRIGARSHLEDITLKVDLDYLPGERHHLRFGLFGSRQRLDPELTYQKIGTMDSVWQDLTEGTLYSFGGYAEDEWKVGDRWTLNPGFRLSALKTADERWYFAAEPRVSLVHLLSESSSLKASFTLMHQSLHLLQNSSLAWNIDMWVPVTRKIKPGYSLLYSLGYYRQLKHELEFSAEAWYNDFRRTVRYENGIHYLKQKDKTWQDYALIGRGRAYGLDLMLNKPHGSLNGWVAYSISKAERSYPGIDNGLWFPSEYDRRHKINLVGNYVFPSSADRVFRKILSAAFTFSSGNYTTVGHRIYPLANAEGALKQETNFYYPEYIERPNNTRLPAYHHLDITLHLQNQKRKGESWSLGIYNIYFRKNPSFYYQRRHSGKNELRHVSLLPFVPCITYQYRF